MSATNTQNILVADIHCTERRRPVDEDKAHELARSIQHEGLYQAIGIVPCACEQYAKRHYRVIFGAHRLVAYQILQRPTIPASVWDETLQPEEYRLIELQENSARNDHTGVQRKAYAIDIGKLIDILIAQRHDDIVEKKWLEELSKRLGVTSRTILRWWADFCEKTGCSHTRV